MWLNIPIKAFSKIRVTVVPNKKSEDLRLQTFDFNRRFERTTFEALFVVFEEVSPLSSIKSESLKIMVLKDSCYLLILLPQ
jgi:hypothetical protein